MLRHALSPRRDSARARLEVAKGLKRTRPSSLSRGLGWAEEIAVSPDLTDFAPGFILLRDYPPSFLSPLVFAPLREWGGGGEGVREEKRKGDNGANGEVQLPLRRLPRSSSALLPNG